MCVPVLEAGLLIWPGSSCRLVVGNSSCGSRFLLERADLFGARVGGGFSRMQVPFVDGLWRMPSPAVLL